MKFCTEWKHVKFDNVFMTDESVFKLHCNTLQVWSSQNSLKPVKNMPKFTVEIMVWGALSYKGFYLKVVEGN